MEDNSFDEHSIDPFQYSSEPEQEEQEEQEEEWDDPIDQPHAHLFAQDEAYPSDDSEDDWYPPGGTDDFFMQHFPFMNAMLPLVIGNFPSSQPSSRQSTAEQSAAPSEPVLTPTRRRSFSPFVDGQADRATPAQVPAQEPAQGALAPPASARPRQGEPQPLEQQPEAYEADSDNDSDATRSDVEVHRPPPVAPEREEQDQEEEDIDATQPDIDSSDLTLASTQTAQQPPPTLLPNNSPASPTALAPTDLTLLPHDHDDPDSAELPAPKRQRTIPPNDPDTHLDIHTIDAMSDHRSNEPLIATAPEMQRMPALTNTVTCPICLEVPRNAVATPCGHMLCGECLFKSIRSDAVHRQRDKEEADRREVARAVLWMRPAEVVPLEPIEANQGEERIFLSAAQLVEVLDDALGNATKNQLQSYIERNRNASCQTIGWIQFVNLLVDTATTIGRRDGTNGRTTPTIPASNGMIRR